MKLINVEIHKYKSFETNQKFDLDKDITILVGMNESGKTSALEAIAKTNYFQDDDLFKFNLTHDYPRKEKKKIDKSGDNPKAITCTYEIPKWLIEKISEDIGNGVLKSKEFSITTKFRNSSRTFGGLSADFNKFIVFNNSPLKIYYMSHAAMAANSTSSLTSLSFNLLFGFMPDTQINRSSR